MAPHAARSARQRRENELAREERRRFERASCGRRGDRPVTVREIELRDPHSTSQKPVNGKTHTTETFFVTTGTGRSNAIVANMREKKPLPLGEAFNPGGPSRKLLELSSRLSYRRKRRSLQRLRRPRCLPLPLASRVREAVDFRREAVHPPIGRSCRAT